MGLGAFSGWVSAKVGVLCGLMAVDSILWGNLEALKL
ncbi:MAG: hypothetical protein ACJAQ8_000420 [Haliea salexigens]|jgi:hypothetical protein